MARSGAGIIAPYPAAARRDQLIVSCAARRSEIDQVEIRGLVLTILDGRARPTTPGTTVAAAEMPAAAWP